ncbi:MAG: Rieske (2Fe-2S) protein [Geminicoccaceae bacterium]
MAESGRTRSSCGVFDIVSDRRRLVAGGTGLLAGLAWWPQDAEAAKKPDSLGPQAGDRIQATRGALKGELLRPEHLELNGAPIEGFPFAVAEEVLRKRNRFNRVLVMRLDPAEMDEETAARTGDGVLVYSAICTHKGCTIKSWMEEERHLRCHCHLSQFAALSGGSIEGGPARAPLPALPVTIDAEGFIAVAEDFNRKPGFKS